MDLMIFIRHISNIIKNHTKDFQEIESSDISHKCHYKL